MGSHLHVLTTAADLYATAVAKLKPLSGGHVSQVFEFASGDDTYVMRLTPPNGEISAQSMRGIVAWMDYLAMHGASVARPLPSRRGSLVEVIEQDGQTWLASAYRKAPGVLSETLTIDQWSDGLLQCLGKVVGKMHALARSYAPQYRLADWQNSGNYFSSPAELGGELSWMAVRRAGIIGYLNTLPRERDSYGLIHADLHFGNFFVDAANPAITLFDFDDCAYGWYVMDIAMLLFDAMVLYTGADRDRFAASFMASLLHGYVTEYTVSEFWLSQIPHLLKLLEIGVYADVCADYDPQDTQSWVGKFMPGRKQSIADDAPYVHLDWASLLPAS